jgi:Flp pilus assembly protein TadB
MSGMNKSNNMNRILEVFWLIVAIMTGIMGIYGTFTKGLKASYMFFIMAILSCFLYFARRYLRIHNSEKNK